LSHLGDHALFDAVSPFWRTTTAPYGPLFIGIASLVVGVTGEHLVAGIVVMHAVEMIGVVLLAVFTPQLARLCGADPARATWLVLPCPLVLLQLVAAGHNDALMAGLMVAGVTCALRARPLTGIACCALAATVKVPAGIAALFLIAALARESDGLKAQLAVVAKGVASAVAVAVAVSVATGLGTGWISSSVLSTPGKVHLSVTPVTEIGYTIARILSAVNVHVDAHRLESHVGDVAIVVVAAFVAWCAWHARRDNLVVLLAASLFVIALGGPAAWPWYFCWSLVLAAAIPDVQRALLLGVAVALSPLLVKADGILAIPLEYAPLVLACWLALAGSSWHRARRDSVILAALHRPAPHP